MPPAEWPEGKGEVMGRPSLTDDPIIKVTFKNCEKGEIYIRKSFRSEWDELVNNLKKEIRREFKTYKTRSEDGKVMEDGRKES